MSRQSLVNIIRERMIKMGYSEDPLYVQDSLLDSLKKYSNIEGFWDAFMEAHDQLMGWDEGFHRI